MKKVMLILMLGVFTFGSSGFKKSSETQPVVAETSCFDVARTIVIAEDGEINIGNIDRVRFLTFVCEFYNINILYP